MGSLTTVFVAVPIPVEVRIALADRISGMGIPGRTAAPEDWHVTLRFLGRVDQSIVERVGHGLAEVEEIPAFRVGLEGFGAFPNARKATVFWAGIGDGRDELHRLNEISEEAAVGAGVAPEDRPFRPHLTLSRIRPPADVRPLLHGDLTLKWICDRVVLYETRPPGEGVRYRVLETIRLVD